MAENIKIDLEENSPYRVALELARAIANGEGKSTGSDRKYWLELYQKCRSVVVDGWSAEATLSGSGNTR